MVRAVFLSLGLLIGADVRAADPAPTPPTTESKPALSRVAPAGSTAAPGHALDLRLGDLRRFFTPAELQSPLPDMIGDEILVESNRSETADPSRAPVPVGLAAPFWAITHPFSAWRIVLPDPNATYLWAPDAMPSGP